MRRNKERCETIETEMPAILIDTRTKQAETSLDLKKELIKLLADPEVRKQIFEAIITESARRESMARIYK